MICNVTTWLSLKSVICRVNSKAMFNNFEINFPWKSAQENCVLSWMCTSNKENDSKYSSETFYHSENINDLCEIVWSEEN